MAVATQRLYLTVDGEVVLHGDPAGVSLLVAVGQEISDGYAEPGAEPEPEAEVKQVAKPADKAVRKHKDK